VKNTKGGTGSRFTHYFLLKRKGSYVIS